MNAPVGDVPLHLHLLLNGYAHLISDHSVVYRVGAKNSWTKVARKKKSNNIHIRMLNYWKGLDAYTEYKYHDLLKFKIEQKECFIDIEQNPRSFFKKEYKKYRKWLGIKQIIYYIFRAFLKAGDTQ